MLRTPGVVRCVYDARHEVQFDQHMLADAHPCCVFTFAVCFVTLFRSLKERTMPAICLLSQAGYFFWKFSAKLV